MTAATTSFRTRIGKQRLPSGATWSAEGTNFSVYSHVARNNEAAFRPKPLDGAVIYEVLVGGYTPHPDYCD